MFLLSLFNYATLLFLVFSLYKKYKYYWRVISIVSLLYLFVYTLYFLSGSRIYFFIWLLPAIISSVLIIILNIKFLRRNILSKKILKLFIGKNILPNISSSEQILLNSGSQWIESSLFTSNLDFDQILAEPYNKLNFEEDNFMSHEVETLCNMVTDWEIYRERDLPSSVWSYIQKERFLGMIIPKKYGGLEFSLLATSAVVHKLVTRSQVLAITVMVPNSLGPAELLMRYGTDKQRDYYLPRLAIGKDIPCFALTEVEAGSDATAIQSYGELFLDTKDNTIRIRLNWSKRYITLGAKATLIGLAFHLYDPEHLLSDNEYIGITCALIPRELSGIITGRRHDPLAVPFVNSPLDGRDVIISFSDVIGEEAGLGNGWKMLMECLAIGRGISLPALATGGTKYLYRVVGSYTRFRYQFNLPLYRFEGIKDSMSVIGGYSYMLESMRVFTASAVDNGHKPTVINGIVKYHATEKYREAINNAMDILGGAGIIRGPKNLVAHPYMGAPIAVTVEGANIITRSLLHFGQSLMMCHPYLYDEYNAIKNNDSKKFDQVLFSHIGYFVRNIAVSAVNYLTRGHLIAPFRQDVISSYKRRLSRASTSFAVLVDILLLRYGGKLKTKETISGRLGDILSYMYISTSVIRRFIAEDKQEDHVQYIEWSLNYCFNKIDEAFEEIYQNIDLGFMGNLLFKGVVIASKINPIAKTRKDTLNHKIADDMVLNTENKDSLTDSVFVPQEIEGLKIYENAAELMSKCEVVDKKIKESKLITKEDYKAYSKFPKLLLEIAVEKLIITQEEAHEYLLYKDVIYDALTVDSFALKDYLSYQMKDSITKL